MRIGNSAQICKCTGSAKLKFFRRYADGMAGTRNILMDYNMDQTVYFPTLDQYKLSPAIAVQAVEGAPVTAASVPGTVYSIEENVQTGTTLTMELGSGYQADLRTAHRPLTVEEGDTVKTEGTVIGYIGQPTKYYSKGRQ